MFAVLRGVCLGRVSTAVGLIACTTTLALCACDAGPSSGVVTFVQYDINGAPEVGVLIEISDAQGRHQTSVVTGPTGSVQADILAGDMATSRVYGRELPDSPLFLTHADLEPGDVIEIPSARGSFPPCVQVDIEVPVVPGVGVYTAIDSCGDVSFDPFDIIDSEDGIDTVGVCLECADTEVLVLAEDAEAPGTWIGYGRATPTGGSAALGEWRTDWPTLPVTVTSVAPGTVRTVRAGVAGALELFSAGSQQFELELLPPVGQVSASLQVFSEGMAADESFLWSASFTGDLLDETRPLAVDAERMLPPPPQQVAFAMADRRTPIASWENAPSLGGGAPESAEIEFDWGNSYWLARLGGNRTSFRFPTLLNYAAFAPGAGTQLTNGSLLQRWPDSESDAQFGDTRRSTTLRFESVVLPEPSAQ